MGSNSQNIYSIILTDGKLNAELYLVPLDSIRPHEKSISILTDELRSQFLKEGILKDPILADHRRNLVIDGTHRVLALRSIGVDYVPIQYIDYLDPRLKLYRWFRIYRDIGDPRDMYDFISIREFEYDDLDRYAIYFIHQDKMLIILDNADLKDITEYIEDITAKFLRIYRSKPVYISEDELSKIDLHKFDDILVGHRRISKEEVLDAHSKNILLHNKATRHVPPYRVININIPVKLLYRENIDKAIKYLEGIRLEYIGKKVTIEGRYYAEKVYRGIRKS